MISRATRRFVKRSLSQKSAFTRLLFTFGTIEEFRLPDLGEKIKEAVVQKWYVKEGDIVEDFQTLADVSTDKLFTQIPATNPGKIHQLMVEEGEACLVGEILLKLELLDGEETVIVDVKKEAEPAQETEQQDNGNTQQSKADFSTSHSPMIKLGVDFYADGILASPAVRDLAFDLGVDINLVKGSHTNGRILKEDVNNFKKQSKTLTGKVLAAPAVRALARGLGIDLSLVSGSGENGRIVHEDVLSFQTEDVAPTQTSSAEAVEEYEVYNFNMIEQGMVKTMTAAAAIPHFYLKEEYNLTKLMELRSRINATLPKEERISVFAFIIKAYSLAIKKHPKMNSLYFNENPNECQIHSSHNISIAIDSPNGLYAPNIKDCQDKSIAEIQTEIIRLRDLAFNNQIGVNELFGGTIALSNIGTIAGTYLGPLNLPNQSCIVGLGRIRDTPGFVESVEVNGKTLYDVEMKKTINVSFGCDHRTLDGATVARFSVEWQSILENPENFIVQLK